MDCLTSCPPWYAVSAVLLYSKIFICDPDNFPLRTLQPERFLSKIIEIFASTTDTTKKEIDYEKMLTAILTIGARNSITSIAFSITDANYTVETGDEALITRNLRVRY